MNNLDYVTVATEIAYEAGSLLEQYFEKRPAIEYKQEYDLVTAADRASEKLVVERLRSRFPSHSIVGEEGGGVDNSSDYVWYVDPLGRHDEFCPRLPCLRSESGLAAQR